LQRSVTSTVTSEVGSDLVGRAVERTSRNADILSAERSGNAGRTGVWNASCTSSGSKEDGKIMRISKIARVVNIMLGLWLFASAFVWWHSFEQMTHTALVGVFVTLVALTAWRDSSHARDPQRNPDTKPDGAGSRVHFLNAVLGLWLVASLLISRPASQLTLLHNGIMGVLIAMLALVPQPEPSSSLRVHRSS
jgi:hypothetical protein